LYFRCGTAPRPWSRTCGTLLRVRRQIPHADIVLEDQGLTPECRRLAEYFCQRYDGVFLTEANHSQK